MVRIKPVPDNLYTCPECNATAPLIHEFIFESVNIYASCTCKVCQFKFEEVVPVGHTVDYRLSYGSVNKKEYMSSECPEWLFSSVFKTHSQFTNEKVSIERIIYKEYKNVVILNTLDSIYGHVLLKLYNAFHHLERENDIGLIILLPRNFKWLIPKGCAEAWVVDLKLSDMTLGYKALQKFVSDQLPRYHSVYLSKAYSHPFISSADIERLTGITPFKLENFNTQKPIITFILREDRWWFSNPADYWFYRICRKFKALPWGARILTRRQNQLVLKTIKKIKKRLPDAYFNLIGLGVKSIFEEDIKDERELRANLVIEKEWCRVYAKSHMVIGVHGSNMLLPSALAAGCVEILPEDRYGNMVQDISVRYMDRQQLFFYRFADQFSTPKSIANKAVAMIKDYRLFKQNMHTNTYVRAS